MSGPVIAAALRLEQVALRAGTDRVPVVHTGMGPGRSTRWGAARPDPRVGLVVAGLAGGLAADVRPGELVVADRVAQGDRVIEVPSAPLLAAALRRHGHEVHVGTVASSRDVVHGRGRAALAATGALAVDMESASLAEASTGGPFAVVRAIVDTAAHPLLRPGTIARGLAGLASLRRAAPVLADWAAACGDREVLLASPRSFCAGVERAVEIVERAIDRYGAPIHVRRQIVHNAHVVQALQDRGAVFVEELEDVPAGGRVVFAAHGVSPAVREEAEARDLQVIDATCPLVAKVHTEVRRHSARGQTVLLIGHGDHEEMVGTVGEAPDDVLVVENAEQAATVQPRDPQRVAYAMQTTLAADEAEQIAAVLRSRFPGLNGPRRDDICYATTNRQLSVRAVAERSDLVLVVGSANSSNSQRLVEVAERSGTSAQLVEDAGAVDLRALAGTRRVGITAGASAPPHLVDELVACLRGLGSVDVREAHVVDETVRFTLPKEVD